jgi:hypothetical protein
LSERKHLRTKVDDPVDEVTLGKYYLPFVAASQRHLIVAAIDHFDH